MHVDSSLVRSAALLPSNGPKKSRQRERCVGRVAWQKQSDANSSRPNQNDHDDSSRVWKFCNGWMLGGAAAANGRIVNCKGICTKIRVPATLFRRRSVVHLALLRRRTMPRWMMMLCGRKRKDQVFTSWALSRLRVSARSRCRHIGE